MKPKILTLAALLAIFMSTGCTSFNREWKSALQRPTGAQDIAGPWEGRWISEENGHTDRLRCVMTENSTNSYTAYFHAKYRRIFSFSYRVPLEVQRDGERFTFSGTADLGKLAGGTYTYDGNATPTNFFSTYNSKYDHGKFEMTRPATK